MLATIKGWYIRFGMFLTLFGVKWLALMMTHLHKVAKLPTIEEWEASKPKPEQTPAWLVLLDSWVAKAKVLTNELARMGKVGLISRADYTASEKSDHILKMEELPITEGDEVNDDADPMDPRENSARDIGAATHNFGAIRQARCSTPRCNQGYYRPNRRRRQRPQP